MDKQDYYTNMKAKMEEEVKRSEYLAKVQHKLTELYEKRLDIYKNNNFHNPEYINIFKDIISTYEIIFEENFKKATKLSKKISKKENFLDTFDDKEDMILAMDIVSDFNIEDDRFELDNIFSDMESDIEDMQEELEHIKDMGLLSENEIVVLSEKIEKMENIRDNIEDMC